MRIYLTGSTGYIGSALARRLLAAGHQVLAQVRQSSDPAAVQALAGAGATTCVGDIRDRYSLREGMSGADWVIHAAADLEFGGPEERMRAVNVEGCENVASLAYKLGVGRFLLVSSVAVWGGSPADGSPADEDTPRATRHPSLYGATKAAGEMAVRQWAQKGLRTNVVWPSLVYGPPGKRSGTNPLLRALVRGRFPALVGADRKTSWVFLEDLVEAVVRVLERAPVGRDYLLAGSVTTVAEAARLTCQLAGSRPPRLRLPVALADLVLRLAQPLLARRGRRSPFNRAQLANLARHWAFSDQRARRELAWEPRPLADGLVPTVAFLRQLDHPAGGSGAAPPAVGS
jgi:dihydroflavonol-4-reductase